MKTKILCAAGILLLFLALGASGAGAYTIQLDGVANAGLAGEDLSRTYLYIAKDLTSTDYYYKWAFGVGSVPWLSLHALVIDLNDQWLNGGVLDPVDVSGGWYILSGGDVFGKPSSEIWKSISLTEGWYELSLTLDSEAYNLKAYWNENVWNAYVQMWAEYDASFNFGEGFPTYDSEALALEHYRNNVDGMTIHLAQAADLYFYINDNNAVDNAGSVTLDIHAVPEPGTLCLLASGLAGLIGLRRWRRKEARSFSRTLTA